MAGLSSTVTQNEHIGCGISHNNTIHIIQVQFILLQRFHIIQTKGSHKVVIRYK
jgi:hypothetical protein